jgi:hypothetical protein
MLAITRIRLTFIFVQLGLQLILLVALLFALLNEGLEGSSVDLFHFNEDVIIGV